MPARRSIPGSGAPRARRGGAGPWARALTRSAGAAGRGPRGVGRGPRRRRALPLPALALAAALCLGGCPDSSGPGAPGPGAPAPTPPGLDPASPSLAALLRRLEGPDPSARAQAAQALGALKGVPDTAREALLRRVLEDEDHAAREAAEGALLRLDHERYVQGCAAALRAREDPAQRLRALHALSEVGQLAEPALAAVAAALEDRDARVRAEAARVLVALVPPGARDEALIRALYAALGARERVVRVHAALALTTVDPLAAKARPALEEALQDERAEVRRAAVEALGKLRRQAAQVVPALRDLSRQDPDAGVREAAAAALKRIAEARE